MPTASEILQATKSLIGKKPSIKDAATGISGATTPAPKPTPVAPTPEPVSFKEKMTAAVQPTQPTQAPEAGATVQLMADLQKKIAARQKERREFYTQSMGGFKGGEVEVPTIPVQASFAMPTEDQLPTTAPVAIDKGLYYSDKKAYAEQAGYTYNPDTKTFELTDEGKLEHMKQYASPFGVDNALLTGQAELAEEFKQLPKAAKVAGELLGVSFVRDVVLGTGLAMADQWNELTGNLRELLGTEDLVEQEGTPFRDSIESLMQDLDDVEQKIVATEAAELSPDMLAIAQGAETMMAFVGAAKTGNLQNALILFSEMEAIPSYREAIEQGWDKNDALALAGLQGTTSYMLEKWGTEYILEKAFAPGATEAFVNRVIKSFISEGTQELSQEFASAKIDNIALDKAMPTLEDYWRTFWTSGVIGGGVTGAASVKMPEAQQAQEKAMTELKSQGLSESQASTLMDGFGKFAEGKTKELINTMNAPFAESKLVGLTGMEQPGQRPGIERPAPLPETAIPAELKPLAEEAKKYDSAEEFVAAAKKGAIPMDFKTAKQFQATYKVDEGDVATRPQRIEKAATDFYSQVKGTPDKGIALKTDKEAYLTGKRKGTLGESLETPSKSDFAKYEKQFPNIEFKNLDDMKLIRDRATGDLIGVQNREGQRATLGAPIAEAKKEVKRDIKEIKKGLISLTKEQRGKERKQLMERVKKDLVDYAKQNLPLRERGKMLSAVKNANTEKNLQDAMNRIDALQKQWNKRKTVEDIKKLLKRTKVTKQGGKPVGKFTPAAQKSLDLFRDAMGLSVAEARQRVEDNMERLGDDIPPADLALENKILSMRANLKETKAGEVDSLYRELSQMYDTGKMINALKAFNREGAIQRAKDMATDVITGGKGLKPGAKTTGVKDEAGAMKKFFRSIRDTQVGWDDMMDILSGRHKKSKAYESPLSEWADVLEQEMREEGGRNRQSKKMNEMFREAYDLKSDRQVTKRMREDAEKVNLGTFENAAGVVVEIEMSKAEARKRWMELQDKSLHDSFYNAEGMAYTKEMGSAIDSFLTEQDKAFAKAQLDFYSTYYDSVNKTYEEMYGVSLPKSENYSPIKRSDVDKGDPSGLGEFLGEANTRRSIAKGSLKSRVANLKHIDLNSDVSVLQQHTAEMEHFKAWATKVREMNAVFNSAEVKNAIVQEHGQGALKVVQKFVDDFTAGGVGTAQRVKWLDTLRGNFTRGVLAIKPSLTIKQLTSFPAYMENMAVGTYMKEFTKFWANPVGNAKILMESELMKSRGKNMERDIQQAAKSDQAASFKKKQSFLNMLMLNVQLGDQAAILVGGWPVYKSNYDSGIKEGLSHEDAHKKAIRKFEKTTKLAQQSAYLSDLNTMQRMGSFAKLFSMFKTSPNQYFRKEMAAVRGLMTGRASVKQAAKTLAIYHVVLPMIFQFVSDGFEWDWEEQRRAMILGSLNGLFIVGDLMDSSIRYATGMKTWSSEIPVVTIKDDIGKLIKAVKNVDIHDITTEDVMDALDGLTGIAGKSLGVPAQQAFNWVEAAQKMRIGSYYEGMGIVMGWSPYKMEQKFGKGKFDEAMRESKKKPFTEEETAAFKQQLKTNLERGELTEEEAEKKVKDFIRNQEKAEVNQKIAAKMQEKNITGEEAEELLNAFYDEGAITKEQITIIQEQL
jgi:hypothetical protein